MGSFAGSKGNTGEEEKRGVFELGGYEYRATLRGKVADLVGKTDYADVTR